jgi:hypothetical protein
MKPLNYDNSPCSPTSSNCVIWQGPDLDCIKLCKGDTISDVVESLATELCNVMDQLNITNYELSCFNLVSCPPKTFQELIQFLIDKICEIQNIDSNATENAATTCPDCLVSIAPCFINDDSGFVNQTMQLIDYVTLIGQTLCNLINETVAVNLEITNLKSITTSLQTQISNILPYTLPLITITTPISSYPINSQVPLDNLLGTFINNVWAPYVASTGSSSEILAAVYQKTILNSTLQLANGQPFINKATWISDVIYNSAADAINNIWSVIDDLFFYVTNQNITVVDTQSIDLTLTGSYQLSANITDTGWVNLEGFNLYMNQATGTLYTYPQVRRVGNVLHFKGDLIIPCATDNTGLNVDPWILTTTLSSVQTNNFIQPFTSAGGVKINSTSSIEFNVDSGLNSNPVVPASVLGSNVIDDDYTTDFIIFTRSIVIAANTSSLLSSLMQIRLSAGGILSLNLLNNSEITSTKTNINGASTSHLNYIVSHVKAGDNVPDFNNVVTNVNSNTGSGTIGLDLRYSATNTYPFACNANDATQVSGFSAKLDGFKVFLTNI